VIVAVDKADLSPLVKLNAFGYRAPGVPTGFAEVSLPQIPHGSDFVVRGKRTDNGLERGITTARLQVDRGEAGAEQSLTRSPLFELSVPTAELRSGRHELHVVARGPGGNDVPFEKPIVFEVDSAADRIPAGVPDAKPLAGAVDICCRLGSRSAHATELQLPGDALTVQGWAYDPAARSTGRLLLVVIDGTRAFRADYGIPRPDVVAFFRNPAFRDTGYVAAVPASAFSVGEHTLNLVLLAKDGRHFYTLAKPAASFSVRR
jgi:hypothetical protein